MNQRIEAEVDIFRLVFSVARVTMRHHALSLTNEVCKNQISCISFEYTKVTGVWMMISKQMKYQNMVLIATFLSKASSNVGLAMIFMSNEIEIHKN